jgi:hypothetical protein
VPLAAWYSVAMRDATPADWLERALDISILGALAPWRYTQGIYRFDAALLDALADTPLNSILPAAVLLRLPQWSVYVETPPEQFVFDGRPLHGFWAYLEWDAGDVNRGRHELRLLLDTEPGLAPIILHLGPWTVREALRRAVAEAQRVATARDMDVSLQPDAYAPRMADAVTPLLSLLLYLCADAPEIDSEREPGTSPHNPEPRRIKRGVRIFPPAKPTLWQVGAQIGAQLRTAGMRGDLPDGERRSPRAHVRRAHWHGYWTGPRDQPDARGFVYHWLPPQVVGGE